MNDPIIAGLHSQYTATVDVLNLAIDHCPDEFWDSEFGDYQPFWKEAYHMLHYFVKYAHGRNDPVETPFGQHLDPTLVNKPHISLSRDEILSYISQAREHLDTLFAELTPEDLTAPDPYDPRFKSVFQRLAYGLRHGQHHAGKLTGYLFCNGINYDPWR